LLILATADFSEMGCLHSTMKKSTSDSSEYARHQQVCTDLQATKKYNFKNKTLNFKIKIFRNESLIVEILKQSFKKEESDENLVLKDDTAKKSMVPIPGEDVIFKRYFTAYCNKQAVTFMSSI
jgi:hypothetical protein